MYLILQQVFKRPLGEKVIVTKGVVCVRGSFAKFIKK